MQFWHTAQCKAPLSGHSSVTAQGAHCAPGKAGKDGGEDREKSYSPHMLIYAGWVFHSACFHARYDIHEERIFGKKLPKTWC